MGQPYIGEIRIFAGNFPPNGWMFCDGALLPISEYETLFQLIGTTYGGDGQSTFQLPDLRGRLPVHAGNGFSMGGAAGVESVTLTTSQIPSHTHALTGTSDPATQSSPAGNVLAQPASGDLYDGVTPSHPLAPTAVQAAGQSQAHDNRQPYLAVNFIISLFGQFPSQS